MKQSFGSVFLVLVFLTVLLSGCSPASTPPPTSVPLTFTPSPIPPTSTPEPTATATPTNTPIPTPTLPFEIPSPTTGKGTVIGLVLWNGEPVVKNMVNLCVGFDDNGDCYGKRYSTTSNSQGYYIFEDVEPGEYVLRINMFSAGWYHVVDESDEPIYDIVKADEITIFDPLDIYKFDLKTTYPHGSGAVVVIETQPTLKWEEYPNADYYIVQLTSCKSVTAEGVCKPDVESPKIEGGQTSFLVSPPLEVGSQYFWSVTAYNKSGTKIAVGSGDAFYVLNP
jgi:hypothetical protein